MDTTRMTPSESRRHELVVSAIAETLSSPTILELMNVQIHVDEMIEEIIRKQRRVHIPWARIGYQLGISGQAASRKYRNIR